MVNCTDAPDAVSSDAGVAGIGVLLSFIITAIIALLLSASLIVQEARSLRKHHTHAKPSVLRRKLLSAYSDQQILTGIGIQCVGLAKYGSLASYHFFLVWMLSLLSTAVHNAALLALVHDFRRDWVLRWLRQALMFVNLALSSTYAVFMLRSVARGVNNTTLPVGCVWEDDSDVDLNGKGGGGGNNGLSYVATIAVLAGNVVVFGAATWYLHSRAQRFYRATQIAGLTLSAAIAIGATARVALLADAFGGHPGVALADPGERAWSFGQLLSVGMLALPLVSAVEILRGEIQCAPPVADDGGDGKARLLGDDGGGNELRDTGKSRGVRASFQPNPLWGSNSNFFKK
ncbi:hypothetical protein F4780DRAFT_368501 [Xylariomycetidae sp. FL0641]|nr:hypothetical protein F4780DRAFT_368501 [Xylariomycetidae sp. FL0641]